MPDITIGQSLLPATLGGFLGAIGSYFVQRLLRARDQRDQERRRAYIHLVRISHVMILGHVIKEEVAQHKPVMDALRETMARVAGQEIGYAESTCATIYELIRAKHPDGIEVVERTKYLFGRLKPIFNDITSFDLSIDEQAKLPRNVVMDYSFFIHGLQDLKTSVRVIESFLEDDERLTPVDLYTAWHGIRLFYDLSLRLADGLRRHGRLSPDELDQIIAEGRRRAGNSLKEQRESAAEIEALLVHLKPLVQTFASATEREAKSL